MICACSVCCEWLPATTTTNISSIPVQFTKTKTLCKLMLSISAFLSCGLDYKRSKKKNSHNSSSSSSSLLSNPATSSDFSLGFSALFVGEISGSCKQLYQGRFALAGCQSVSVETSEWDTSVWPFYRMDFKLLADLRGQLRASRGANEKSHSSPVCLRVDMRVCVQLIMGWRGNRQFETLRSCLHVAEHVELKLVCSERK